VLKSRLKMFPQAKKNTQMLYVQEKYRFNNKTALYPWTSGRFGNATATGPVMNYEYHVNTDIAISMFQYLAITGDEAYFENELWPVVESIGQSMVTLMVKDGAKWSIRNMTDPDEYAVFHPLPTVRHLEENHAAINPITTSIFLFLAPTNIIVLGIASNTL